MKIAVESWPIVLSIAGVALVGGAFLHPWVAIACAPLLLFTLWFFRDPERRPPPGDDALLAPADGRVIRCGPDRLSIFMNVLDVHVCRSPLAGAVAEVERHRGRFVAAYRDDAAEHNERVSIVVAAPGRRVRFTLVAGLIARRIVCRVRPGQQLAAGERIGLIRFGSRVDVDLPPGTRVAVGRGDRVVAGVTALAALPAARPAGFGYSGAADEGRDVPVARGSDHA
jgi:phosphatidylserine decarboxylase